MSVSLNSCQKLCVQLSNPGGTSPYTWTSSNPSVGVLSSGSGLSAIIVGNSSGGANIVAKDASGSVAAVFIVTVTAVANQTTPSSNTSLIASARTSSSTTNTAGLATLSGSFSTFASGFSTGNVGYFIIGATAGSGSLFVGVLNAFWNRPSANTISVDFNNNTGAPNNITFGVVGLAVTTATPSLTTLDYQIPIVQYITGTQSVSAFSTLITLPFVLPCTDTSNYMCFAQNSTTSPSTNTILVSSVLSASQLKVGWLNTTTSYALSYSVITKGIRNAAGTVALYSDIISVSLSGTAGNNTASITLDIAIPATSVWLIQIQPSTINDASAFAKRILGSQQTSTTVLQVYYRNLTSASTTIVNLGIAAFNNLNSAITMTA